MKYVTETRIDYYEAYLMSERFILLNMGPGGGIWLVDREHSKWEAIKETAINVAKTFGDKEAIQKIEEFEAIDIKT